MFSHPKGVLHGWKLTLPKDIRLCLNNIFMEELFVLNDKLMVFLIILNVLLFLVDVGWLTYDA